MSLFFAPGPSYRPTSTFLTNTFTAGQIFTGSDLGAAGAGEVRIGGGLVRAGVGIIGTDPGGSELLRVGGSMRCQRASINGGYVFADGDIGVARTSSTGGIYFGTANTRYLYYDGTNYNLAGGGMIIGTDPNPGGGEKLRVGGGIFSTAAQTIDLGTGALPAELGAGHRKLALAGADGEPVNIEMFGIGQSPVIRGRVSNGTRAAPTATTDGLILIGMAGHGHDGTGWTTGPSAGFYTLNADGLWSGTNRGIGHVWTGTPNGSTTRAEWMRLRNASLIIGTDPNPGGSELLRVGGTIRQSWNGASPYAHDAAGLRLSGGYGGLITLENTGFGSWSMWCQNAGNDLYFGNGAAGAARTSRVIFDGSGNVGIGVTPTAGNGKLQLPAGTAKADGIGFGGDTFLFRNTGDSLMLAGSSDTAFVLRNTSSGGNIHVEVGTGGTGNRSAYIDLVGDDTYTDYGLRIIRGNTGANANSEIAHRGTGGLRISTSEAAFIEFFTNGISRGSWSTSGALIVSGSADGILVVNGKITAKAAVPASFADLAAVRTYLASILT
jgi:hypothetical protein